jgi:hypothetical protein
MFKKRKVKKLKARIMLLHSIKRDISNISRLYQSELEIPANSYVFNNQQLKNAIFLSELNVKHHNLYMREFL